MLWMPGLIYWVWMISYQLIQNHFCYDLIEKHNYNTVLKDHEKTFYGKFLA